METGDANKNQTIKSQRVRSYFIKAAKDIIESEGVDSISVRKIADSAGYSYATIYNYFKDISALLSEVRIEMIKDVMSYMNTHSPSSLKNIEDFKKINKVYIDYYVSNPNIFNFFYVHQKNTSVFNISEMPDLDEKRRKPYRELVLNGSIREEDVDIVSKTLIYTLHGLLSLYFSNNGMTISQCYDEMDAITEYLLKGRK